MKRLLLLVLAVLAVGALASTASAAPPILHEVKSPFSFSPVYPAGSFCDFNLRMDITGTDTFTILANGYEQVLEHLQTTSTNLDTGASVYDAESYHLTGNWIDGGFKVVGVMLKLRDATGTLVIHDAGQVVFDANYNVVKFTPNVGPSSLADELCPALGGNPAP